MSVLSAFKNARQGNVVLRGDDTALPPHAMIPELMNIIQKQELCPLTQTDVPFSFTDNVCGLYDFICCVSPSESCTETIDLRAVTDLSCTASKPVRQRRSGTRPNSRFSLSLRKHDTACFVSRINST